MISETFDILKSLCHKRIGRIPELRIAFLEVVEEFERIVTGRQQVHYPVSST